MMQGISHRSRLPSDLTFETRTVLLFVLFITPFLSALHWAGSLLAYLIAAAFIGQYIKQIPLLYIVKFVLIGALAFVHINSTASVVNIMTYIVADLYCIAMGAILIRYGFAQGCASLARVCLYIVGIGTAFSIVASVATDIANPITWFLRSGRLLILQSEGAGHSIVIQAATIMLCAVLAGTWRPGIGRVPAAIGIAVLLMAAGSSTAALMLVTIVGVSLFERLSFPLLKTLLHLLTIAAVVALLSNPVRLNETLGWFRTEIAGQERELYRKGDFTAGRAMLTVLLLDLTQQAPVVGVGDEHPVLRYGIRTVKSNTFSTAASESPLRLAAKYGWPLFAWTMLIAAMPLIVGLLSSGTMRRFLVPMGYAILISTTTNAGFGVAQSPTYILFGPIVAFAIFAWQRRHLPGG